MANMGAVTIAKCSWAQVSDEFGGTPKLLRQRRKAQLFGKPAG
jgi:hypothetical protein